MKTTAIALIATLAIAPAAACAHAPSATGPDATSLTFAFDVGANTGRVMVALYDSQAAYDGQGAPLRSAMVDVASGKTSVTFDLPAGTYAMKSYHDVDGDGVMDTNPFGMPTEPFAFSNNAVGNMGPASWDRARVTVSGAIAQTIRLK